MDLSELRELLTQARLPRVAARRLLTSLGPEPQRDLALDLLRNLGPETDAELAWPVIEDLLVRSKTAERAQLYARFETTQLNDARSVPYAVGVFQARRALIETHLGSIEGLQLLELGPGHTLVGGVCFHALGAATYTAIDLEPLVTFAAAPYRSLRERIARPPLLPGDEGEPERRADALARFDQVVTFDPNTQTATLDPALVAYRTPVDAARLPFPDGQFDVVISHAAFEHFDDPAAAIAETARVLRPGGIGTHAIDYRDHRDFDQPLEFLTLSEPAWQAQIAAGEEYTNRWRHGAFVDAFAAAGFETLQRRVSQTRPVAEALQRRLDPTFRALPPEELEALSASFVVRKP